MEEQLCNLTVNAVAERLDAKRSAALVRKIRRYCVRGVVGKKFGRDWLLSEADVLVMARYIDRPAGNRPDWKNGKNPQEKARKSREITNP